MTRSEKRKSGIGAFFGGTFIGFLLGIGLVVGLACLFYFKASPKWINKTFKTNISLGSDKLDEKTLNQLVKEVNGVIKNKDTYTLNDLNKDFGVKVGDELVGIKIADLKEVGLTDLPKAIEKKFGTISAYELKNVNGMNLNDQMGHILDKANTYYFKTIDRKLYKTFDGTTYSNEVNFDYIVNEANNKVTTKGHETDIVDGKAEIELWYLPFSVALGDFTKNMGDNITLYDLEEEFGVKLPNFLNGVDKQNTTVNELGDAINGLYIADFMNYAINGDKVYDGATEVKGVLARVAKLKVEEIKTQMETLVDTLTLEEVFDETALNSGLLSLLPKDTTVAQIPSKIQTVIDTTNINTLVQKGVVTVEDASTLTVLVDHDGKSETENKAIGLLTVDEFMDFCLANIDKITTLS